MKRRAHFGNYAALRAATNLMIAKRLSPQKPIGTSLIEGKPSLSAQCTKALLMRDGEQD